MATTRVLNVVLEEGNQVTGLMSIIRGEGAWVLKWTPENMKNLTDVAFALDVPQVIVIGTSDGPDPLDRLGFSWVEQLAVYARVIG
jgi:hypothetical protein